MPARGVEKLRPSSAEELMGGDAEKVELQGSIEDDVMDRFVIFIAYVLYPNLYQCGPFMPFDAFSRGPIMVSRRAAGAPAANNEFRTEQQPLLHSSRLANKDIAAHETTGTRLSPVIHAVQSILSRVIGSRSRWRALILALAQVLAW